MKRCNCDHTANGPVQHTGSSLYPDTGINRRQPCPPAPPFPPCPPRPVPPVCPDASSAFKRVYIEGDGEYIDVESKESVYNVKYKVKYIGDKTSYKLVPYTDSEINDICSPLDLM